MSLSRESLELVDAIVSSLSLPASADDLETKAAAISKLLREVRQEIAEMDECTPPR